MHYYQFNIADYRKDTYPLTPVQHMMYRWLIDEYYLNEQPLNNDMPKLLWKLGMDESYRADLELILENFFEPASDDDYDAIPNENQAQILEYPELCQYWIHQRIEADIAEYHTNIEKKSRAGKASGKARERKLNTWSTHDEQNANSVELTINHKPITNNHKPDKDILPENLKISMPPDFKLNETNSAWLNNSHLTDFEKTQVIRDFIDYWILDESKKTLKGWQMAFRKNPVVKRAITNSKHRGRHNEPHQQTHKPSLAERATNARKQFERENNS